MYKRKAATVRGLLPFCFLFYFIKRLRWEMHLWEGLEAVFCE